MTKAPPASTAQVWLEPALIHVDVPDPGSVTTCGVSTSFVAAPLPSWPWPSKPQQATLPVLIVAITLMVVGAMAAGAHTSNMAITPGLIAGGVGVAVLPALILGLARRASRRQLRAFENPRLLVAEGQAVSWPLFSDQFVAEVGGVRFGVFQDQAQALAEDRTYRVHDISTGTRVPAVLSIEVVD